MEAIGFPELLMQVKYEAPPLSVAACLITRPGFTAGLAETVVPITAPPVAVTFPVVVSDAMHGNISRGGVGREPLVFCG